MDGIRAIWSNIALPSHLHHTDIAAYIGQHVNIRATKVAIIAYTQKYLRLQVLNIQHFLTQSGDK